MFLIIKINVYKFNSLTKEYSSYRPLPLCRPSDFVRYPETIQDVQSIVLEAIARNITVKVFGARHSQTDIICTEGIPVQNIGLKYFQINADQTATFGSGVSLYEANEFLRANNRGLKTTPAFGNITLGGAIGTGSHGSTIKHYSSISSQVISLVVVDGLGKLVQITDEAELRSFRINLGLLGIVVRITLLTQPLYKVIAHNYVTSEDVLTDGTAIQWARDADQMSIYWFPSAREVIIANSFLDLCIYTVFIYCIIYCIIVIIKTNISRKETKQLN